MRTDLIYRDAARVLDSVDFSFLEGKTVLVTGATGMLGTHFLATLALLKKKGMNIYAYAHCHSHPAKHTQEIAKDGGIKLHLPNFADVIIHAAGYAQPAVFTADPAETIRLNTEWTSQLLRYLKPGGKFLFVSSSEVYSGLSGLVNEFNIGTTTPYHPRACYIEGKRCGEAIVYASRQNGFYAKSARLSLTYGPGARKGDKRAMSVFIDEALDNGKITMRYPGEERRTFCYISDAVEMLWNICLHGRELVYNVGAPDNLRMMNIVRIIETFTGSKIIRSAYEIEMPGSPEGAIMDTALVGKEFKKSTYVPIWEGLENTIEWHRGLREAV